MLTAPLACQRGPEAESFDPLADPNKIIIPTIRPGTEEPKSSLRIRYQDEGNLNPLLEHSYSTQSVFSLVYDSLFTFDSTGLLQKNLVDSAILDDDELMWTLNIKDISFHSGQKLTSDDVKASLIFWLENNLEHTPAVLIDSETGPTSEEETDTETGFTDVTDTDETEETEENTENDSEPVSTTDNNLTTETDSEENTTESDSEASDDEFDYYLDTPLLGESAQIDLYSGTLAVSLGRGRLIEAINTPDSDTIEIKLQKPAPILDLLTFPVIPAEYVASKAYEIIPGTNDYQIVEREVNGNLRLLRQKDQAAQINEIIAYNCLGVMEALEQFENNNIDILLLNREEGDRLQKRSRVKSQDYRDSGFVSLYIPNNQLKMQIQAYISDGDPNHLSAPFPYSPYYTRAGDFRLFAQTEIVETKDPGQSLSENNSTMATFTDESANFEDSGQENLPLCRILMPRVFYPLALQTKLTSLLLQIGYEPELIVEKAEDYQSQLAEGDYDIALLLDESSCYGDPLDYARGLLIQNLIEDIPLSEASFLILEKGRTKQAMIFESKEETDNHYLQAVHDLFSELPVIGLCTCSSLLWYQDGIEGILNGTAELPYEGIESLKVWQP